MSYVPIEGALGAIKTGFDLLRGARELLKKDKVDPAEVSSQLVELQGLLMDTRSALADAQDYIARLEADLANRGRIDEIDRLLVYDQSVLWKRVGNGDAVARDPYCPVCWQKEKRLSHLTPGATEGTYVCQIDGTNYDTDDYDPKPIPRRRRW